MAVKIRLAQNSQVVYADTRSENVAYILLVPCWISLLHNIYIIRTVPPTM